jgi:glycine cleavage system T protein (aminomethyltransferase)
MHAVSKQTPLHGWHRSRGAQMADFAGYEMPLWYDSAKNEHLSVLTCAGLFDTTHMAVLTVQGRDAFDLLQYTFTNDLAGCIGPHKKPLFPGRCVYGAFLTASGGVLDDAIVFQVAEADYMVVVNAGMGPLIAAHLVRQRGGHQAHVNDLSDQVGKIDIQGPASVAIMQAVLAAPETVLEKLPYFSFKGHFQTGAPGAGDAGFKNGISALISRTGYTGEVGFEIFCARGDVQNLWMLLLETGTSRGLRPCGLAARDSLRAGAVLPLSHQDIGPWPFINNPWPFALPCAADGGFTKTFLGAEALGNAPEAEFTYAFAGFDLRKVTLGDATVVMDEQGHPMGSVTTCATDMGIDRHEGRIFSVASPDKPADMRFKGLCCGFVKVERPLEAGRRVLLKDSRRTISVEIVDNVRPDRTARLPLRNFL